MKVLFKKIRRQIRFHGPECKTDLPGFQGPKHASLLSNNNLKHELSSNPDGSLSFANHQKGK